MAGDSMKLHAILSWYDESPTWLSTCVASLRKAGVSHVIAVDGRYPHFAIGENVRSPLEQADAIVGAAEAVGMGITLLRPTTPMTESEKRTLCFRLLEASAEVFTDWVIVLDADEMIEGEAPSLPSELASLPDSTHVAACVVANTTDPYARPEADNDVSDKTMEIHQKFSIPVRFSSRQSRMWRVMRNMHTPVTHFNYLGTDSCGIEWNLRPDIGSQNLPDHPKSDIHMVEQPLAIIHRKNHRTALRQQEKREYYAMRDELGVERVTT